MSYCKGRVTAVHHHSGCCEVVVEGEYPGTFAIDNLCMWSIVDEEGADWSGREIEYEDGYMRFLDAVPDSPTPHPAPISHPYSLS